MFPSTRNFFGTDGIRAQSNTEPMTAKTALTVAQAAAKHFKQNHVHHRPKVVIGKDTRLSGYMIETAMASGFLSMGMDVVMVGPMPTPAIAMLTKSMRADLGVMISASHNPYQDNGIKLFGADGFKLSDAVELEIEHHMGNPFTDDLAKPRDIGRAQRVDEESGRYVEFVKRSFPDNLSLDGLKVVVDCANGAAYKAAPKILFELGAQVIPLAVSPNGFNINDECGATATQMMQDAVVAQNADIGLALDGDADRLIVCDEKGKRIDGDQIMAVIARDWHERGILKGNGVAMNTMSNLGLERFLENLNLHLHRTPVGDRYVMQAMRDKGYNLGGEQSGHFIALDHCTTGDGLIAGLQILAVLKKSQKPASSILNAFTPVPQILKNIEFYGPNPLDQDDISDYLNNIQTDLKGKGRLLVRKSGTQQLIRVMVESDDQAMVTGLIDDICARIKNAC